MLNIQELAVVDKAVIPDGLGDTAVDLRPCLRHIRWRKVDLVQAVDGEWTLGAGEEVKEELSGTRTMRGVELVIAFG